MTLDVPERTRLGVKGIERGVRVRRGVRQKGPDVYGRGVGWDC